MSLLDPEEYDEARGRRRHVWLGAIAIIVLFLLWLAYHMRDYPERRAVDNFFNTLQKQDYESAYAIWFNDPQWKQHPQQYHDYLYNDFYRDWGPGGEWGIVKNHVVDCSFATESGVVVEVTVNQRSEHPYMYVMKSNQTLSFAPNEIQCGNLGWLME